MSVIMSDVTGGLQIIFGAENGLYVVLPDSATGKTMLYNKLRKNMKAFNGEVLVYSYTDFKMGLRLEDLVDYTKHKVLFIDRYDMINTDYTDIINKFAENGVVILDLKVRFNLLKNCKHKRKYMPIIYSKNKLEVITNDIYHRRWK